MAMDTFPLDNTTYNADDLGMWFATRTSGVLSTGANLSVVASGSGTTVTVNPGLCWLKMADDWGVAARLPSTQNLTLDIGDSLKYRIDNVVIRLDRTQNITLPAVVKGALFSSKATAVATAPARNANYYEIVIARIAVDKGTTTITSGMITDTRLDSTVCGIVRDGITGIDTSVLQAQATAQIDAINAVLDQTIADGLPDGSVSTAKFASNAKAPSAVTVDSIPDGIVSTAKFARTAKAPSAVTVDSVAWGSVTSKPTTFTPATHTHITTDISSGVFGVARGGTGATTLTAGSILMGNGTGAITSIATLDVANGGTGATTLTSGAILLGNGTSAITSTATLPISKGGTGATTVATAQDALGVPAVAETVTKTTSLACSVVASGTIVVAATNGDALIKQGLPSGPIYCCTATHYADVSGDPNYIIATRAYSGSIWARYNSNVTGNVRINYIIYKVV